MNPRAFGTIAALAMVPEHLPSYVRAVSSSHPLWCGECLAWRHTDTLILVGYAPEGTSLEGTSFGGASLEATHAETSPLTTVTSLWHSVVDQATKQVIKQAAEQTSHLSCIRRISVLAPFRPSQAPAEAITQTDTYWELPLPATGPDGRYPNQKLRNMLHRASREVRVTMESWAPDHAALVEATINSRPFSPGTRSIFQQLNAYVQTTGVLLSARNDEGALQGFSIADYSALSTAFFMFTFRHPQSPPGTADLLLASVVEQAVERGHTRVNLGLGINAGIAFFKHKWGATPLFPYCETTWNLDAAKPRFWQRFGIPRENI